MLLYPVKFEFSMFWMSQCGNNNKLALQHGEFCIFVTVSCKRPIEEENLGWLHSSYESKWVPSNC